MVTLNPQLARKWNRALSAYKAGKLNEVETICRRLITTKQGFFDAHHLLAVVQTSLGKHDRALASYNRALSIQPDHPEALKNRGIALRLMKRFDESLASFDRALAARPDYVDAFNNRGITLNELGRNTEALAAYDRALAVQPNHADALNNRGVTLNALHRFVEALVCFDDALAGQPNHADALNNRGIALNGLKRHADALESYDRALAFRPNYADALNNRGIALRELKRFDEALTSFDRALAIRPDYAEALNNRGNTMKELKRFEEALAAYDRALAIRPNYVDALNNRGIALRELRRFEEALDSYDRALAFRPDYVEAYSNMGSVLEELGRFDEARAAIETAIRLSPRIPDLYLALTRSKQFMAEDLHLASMQELAQAIESLTPEQQISLHFALGKALADIGEYEQSFRHLLHGNSLKRQRIAYDEAATRGYFQAIKTEFTAEVMRNKGGLGHYSEVPVFIVGMPRSGSTLVEQILASHPKVFGAGELDHFATSIAKLHPPVQFPAGIEAIAADQVHLLGSNYLDVTAELAPEAARIIDKMPLNFQFVGLIHLALPHARIIHTRRDPVDTCLSCFSMLFVDGQPFSYDLGELGRYYRAYQALMGHWRNVLPAGVMLELQYEELVADPESQARRLVAHCGLEWDNSCLAHHQTKRPVRTASAMQVRQPIYRSAVGRWRPPHDMLRPLLEGLGMVSPVD